MVDPITFDLTRIQEWTRLRQDETPEGPYMATYVKEDRTLLYIAAHHEKKDEANPTLPLISAALNANPKAVIIETTPDYRVQPGDILGNNEVKYTAALAELKQIPWIAGEASNAEVFTHLKHQGYTEQDASNFYIMRAMIADKQDNPELSEVDLFKKASSQFPPEDRPSHALFKQWFDAHNDSGKGLMSMTDKDVAPTLSEDATYFTTISHHVSAAREEHLDQLIENALNEYGEVAVVYGKGHHVKSEKVYEVALGKPLITEGSVLSGGVDNMVKPNIPVVLESAKRRDR